METEKAEPRLDRRRDAWAGALLVVVTALAYFPALRGGFIWDDDTFLTANKLILARDGLRGFWCTTLAPDYLPVTYSPLWFEWRLWGLHTLGYHVVNLGLHLGEALLLWAVLRRLKIPGAYLAAFVFAVHPVNVESVAWITQRKNVMAMLFYLASLWCFLKTEIFRDAAENRIEVGTGGPPVRQLRRSQESATDGRAACPYPREGRWYWLSLLAFTLGMLSKGSIAILPGVFLGLIAWQRRLRLRDGILLLPFFVVSAVLVLVDVWFQKHGDVHQVYRTAGFVERLLGAAGAVWFYLYKALLPFHLIFVYPQWQIRVADPLWWVPLLAAITFTVFLWHYRHRGTRPALFAWGYFCLALLPVMGFADVQFVQFSLVADHYQHLALIGVIAFAAAAWSSFRPSASPSFRRAGRFAAGVVIGLLALLTWRQCRDYRSAETLYQATVDQNPDCWMAHNNLGSILYQSGRLPGAIAHYEAALRLKPDLLDAQSNLGLALAATGRLPEALEHFDQAEWLGPHNPVVYYNRGIALANAGRTAEAVVQYEHALQLNPDYTRAHLDLADALTAMGRLPEALAHYAQTLRLDPDNAAARANFGTALAQSGQVEQAVAQFAAAARLQPGNPEIHNNLGCALGQLGRIAEARAQFEEALRLKPGDAEAHSNLDRLRALPQGSN